MKPVMRKWLSISGFWISGFACATMIGGIMNGRTAEVWYGGVVMLGQALIGWINFGTVEGGQGS